MRALVVEDDPTSAKLIDAALKGEGIICEPADTGEDAIDLAKHYDFDTGQSGEWAEGFRET